MPSSRHEKHDEHNSPVGKPVLTVDKKTCTLDDCTAPHEARGLCKRHYKMVRRAEGAPGEHCEAKRRQPVEVTCSTCAKRYTITHRTAAAANRSKQCAPCATSARRTRWPSSRITVTDCAHCGRTFTARKAYAKWCSAPCMRDAEGERMGWRGNGSCRDCGGVRPKWAPYCEQCTNQRHEQSRRAYKRKRRARLKGAAADTIYPLYIYQRDAWRCGLCHKQVSKRLAYPHPFSASLDHIIPLSDGGSHTASNVQLAHLQCNIAKGNRAGGQLRLIG